MLAPLAVTDAFSVAPVVEIALAALVTTVGALTPPVHARAYRRVQEKVQRVSAAYNCIANPEHHLAACVEVLVSSLLRSLETEKNDVCVVAIAQDTKINLEANG